MRRKRRQTELFSLSFLDILSGALGAVIILYVALPKTQSVPEVVGPDVAQALQVEISKKDQMIKELKASLAQKESDAQVTSVPPPAPARDGMDVGFKFKGKRIVFIIDTSFSMVDEDRMGQVKAGLKMLITALPLDYRMEIVRYPLGERAPFKSMWGDLKELTEANKSDAFQFVYSLNPLGGTPTREVLLFVLQNYETASDIVLLTDGVPTLHNSNQRDDIYDILRNVREENSSKKVRINAIGVGPDFVRNKNNDQYKFLSLLTQENDGFFVGF